MITTLFVALILAVIGIMAMGAYIKHLENLVGDLREQLYEAGELLPVDVSKEYIDAALFAEDEGDV